jgi:putative ABC transport system permease protein
LFDILQLEFRRGDRATALANPGSLVLTESEAIRRFGALDAIGRTLTLVIAGQPTDYRVTGIVQDVPRNSHLALSIVARADFAQLYGADSPFLTQWMPKNGWVYARLRPGADVDEIERQMPAWERRNIPDQVLGGERMNPGTNADWRLANVRDIHLGEADGGGMRPGNDRATVAAMALIGLLILAMAIVNFVNLATRPRRTAGPRGGAAQGARSVPPAACRPVPRRGDAAGRFGHAVRRALVEAALPFVNRFLETDMALNWWGGDGVLLPAIRAHPRRRRPRRPLSGLFLSRFQPARVLKAEPVARRNRGLGATSQRAGRRPVRRLDRAHHLHRDHPVADRLCPHRRSRATAATASSRSPAVARRCCSHGSRR